MLPEGTFFVSWRPCGLSRALQWSQIHQIISIMRKSFIQNAGACYKAPECSVIAFSLEGVLCESRGSWGQSNQAGENVVEDEYSTIF